MQTWYDCEAVIPCLHREPPFGEAEFKWASVLITWAPRVYVVYKKGNEYDHNGVCQQIVLHGCAGT